MSGSETGVMTNTSMGIQNMHLAYSADGAHSVYKPVPVSGAVNAPTAPAAYHHQAGDGGATPMPKKKRGRPRKYAPDGNMGLALAPPPPSANTPPASVAVGGGGGGFSGGSALQFSPSQAPLTAPTPTQAHPLPPSSSSMKKARGRPPGSGKKSHQQQPNTLGSTGIGFTPHVITVKAGEDVASRIMSFSQHGPRAVCILSANGAISNVTLRQAAMSGGTVTYEGRFEILSLSGSFMLSESAGHRSRIGGLSVSLSGPDGCVLGGGVAGLLTAASPVQVVVGSFMAEERKESRLGHQMEPLSAPYPGFTAQSSPQSRGTPSESSGGPGSPLNQSMGANCNNNNQSGMLGIPWK